MSFILSCDFWFCCGGANDEPADRYHHHPPPPSSQTQMVAVVQAPQVQQQQQPSYHQQMAPHPVAPPPPPPAPAAMGYAMPPPQTHPYWPHVPPTKWYDHPPVPVMRQPVSGCSSVPSGHAPSSPAPAPPPMTTRVYKTPPPVSPQAVPPRHVPSKSHEQSFLPSAETITPSRAPLPSTKAHDPPLAQQQPAQAPWPARQPSKATTIQQIVPPNNKGVLILSKRYDETLVAAVAPTQKPPRATSRVPSMKMKAYDEPPHQLPSKGYHSHSRPVAVPAGNVNVNGSSHAATSSAPLKDYI